MTSPRLTLVGALLTAMALVAAAGAAGSRHGAPFSTLVFASYQDGLSAIFAMNADGSGRQQLTTAQPSLQGQPAYSPDGSRIAYVCGNFELCVMNSDGSGQGRLTTSQWPGKWAYVDHPTWSPDGSQIAFASNADGKFHVYVINADGSGLHRLPGTSWNDDDPAWSPNGTTIAFDRYRSWSGGRSAIYLMNADGTQPRRFTSPVFYVTDPAWSPDGRKIASFGNSRTFYDHDYYRVFRTTVSTRRTRQLTDDACEEAHPAYAPDGSTLVLERSCGVRSGIALRRPLGRMVQITAPGHGFDANPSWRPAAANGPSATSIGPVSSATGDALLVDSYWYWETQNYINYLPVGYVIQTAPRRFTRIRAYDLRAVARLREAGPQTARGSLLQRTATAAFRLDAAANEQYVLAHRAWGHHDDGAGNRHQQAGDRLLTLADRKFTAADNLTTLPY
ncbi:MAG: hypothetical protein E6G24_00575 [Actinobacteria bacterium]|nr:MAG: hypothetical protein E6G24_00575 [Actinomycetota bacterium]